MRRAFVSAGSIVFALMLSGCGIIDSLVAQADDVDHLSEVSAGEPLWQVETQTFGAGPVIIGDTVVSYVVAGNELRLNGYSLETGDLQWSHAAGTGAVSPTSEFAVRPLVDDAGAAHVAFVEYSHFVESENRHRSKLHTVHVATGEIVGTLEDSWLGVLSTCKSESGLCAQVPNYDTNAWDWAVVDASSSVAIFDRSWLPEGASASDFDHHLYSQKLDTGDTLLGRSGDSAWDISLSDLFGSEYTGEETIWGFAMGESGTEVLVEAGVMNLVAETSGTLAFRVFALDADTGEVLWSSDETRSCFGTLWCVGPIQADGIGEGGYLAQPSDLRVVKFDSRTGEEMWGTETIPGLLLEYSSAILRPSVPDFGPLVLATQFGEMLLDADTGEVRSIEEGQSFACQAPGDPYVGHRTGNPSNQKVSFEFSFVTAACGPEGPEFDPMEFSRAVVATASPKPFDAADDWSFAQNQIRVVATLTGLAAFRF